MEQVSRVRGLVEPLVLEPQGRRRGAIVLMLEVNDPEVIAELRRREGDERERYALAALRVGVLAMRTAAGHVDAAAIREAGNTLVGEVRDLLSARATEMT